VFMIDYENILSKYKVKRRRFEFMALFYACAKLPIEPYLVERWPVSFVKATSWGSYFYIIRNKTYYCIQEPTVKEFVKMRLDSAGKKKNRRLFLKAYKNPKWFLSACKRIGLKNPSKFFREQEKSVRCEIVSL
jgi:hypothetical protein